MLRFICLLAIGMTLVGFQARGDADQDHSSHAAKPENKAVPPGGFQIHPDSPAALLARAKEIGLEESQMERLREIEAHSRELARNLLTAKQRDSLAKIAAPAPLPLAPTQKEMCPCCDKKAKAEIEKK